MALFTIERTYVGWSEVDLEAAGIRAEMCTLHFPGMRWIRSYYDAATGHSTCVYEAATEDDIIAHAEQAKLPCDSVRVVEEFLPGALAAE